MTARMTGLLLLAAIGCAQSRPDGGRQVSLAELEQETADLVYFNFVGMDDDFDYFTTPTGREFKVAAAESNLPLRKASEKLRPHIARGSGMALFVKLKDGKWVPPDPEKMSQLFPSPDDGPG